MLYRLSVVTLIQTFKVAAVIFHYRDLLFKLVDYIIAIAEDALESDICRPDDRRIFSDDRNDFESIINFIAYQLIDFEISDITLLADARRGIHRSN